jgi:hypothetical protein
MFEIEKGVPPPPSRVQRGYGKYPWHKMEPGDSVKIPPDIWRNAYQSAFKYRERNPETEWRASKADHRIWRIA